MKHKRILAIGMVMTILFVGLGGVGTVAAHENENPDHPACTGDKYKISAEGTDVGGPETGSKWFVKPICAGEEGGPHHHRHEPDDELSMPEGAVQGCHENGRAKSANFADDSC